MKLIKTDLEGVYIVEHNVFKDARGAFVKTFQDSFFRENNLESGFVESYYTRSREDVIRGMHFQLPPNDHAKFVTVIEGTILDVILDLRKESPTYLAHTSLELSRENRKSIYIPRGCAHGFCALSETAIAMYMVTSEYFPNDDAGIRYDSFGFCWPVAEPILSKRDVSFPPLDSFSSPF